MSAAHDDEVEMLMSFLDGSHLPPHLREIVSECRYLAQWFCETEVSVDAIPELKVGLRKLVEAKDCFVRAKIASC